MIAECSQMATASMIDTILIKINNKHNEHCAQQNEYLQSAEPRCNGSLHKKSASLFRSMAWFKPWQRWVHVETLRTVQQLACVVSLLWYAYAEINGMNRAEPWEKLRN